MHTTRTIAIVEDDSLIAQFLREVLSDEGYTVRVYPDGRSGLAAISPQSHRSAARSEPTVDDWVGCSGAYPAAPRSGAADRAHDRKHTAVELGGAGRDGVSGNAV